MNLNIQENNIKVQHIPSENNLADIFTKTMGPVEFTRLRDQIVHQC